MAPPPLTVVSPVLALIVRVLTLITVLVSIIIIATTNATINTAVTTTFSTFVTTTKIKFNDFYAYRYMLASGIIGIAYTLIQIVFTLYFVSTGNRIGGDALALLDFYGDKALSYLLATGAAAGFGLTVDVKRGSDSDMKSFLNRALAAAALIFIGFLFSAISSVFSSLSLPKRS